jgi:mannosyltransferase
MSLPVSLSTQPPPRRSVWAGLRAATLVDFALIFALSLALRLYGLGAKPLWIDEVVTRSRVALPFGKLIATSFSHHHLPTYFLLLAQLSPGANPWLLRLPSAIAGALAAAVGLLVGRKLAGRVGAERIGGLMSGLMLAAAPVMVQFGQDARPYALELVCVMLSLWGLVTLACEAEAAGGSWRQGFGAWSALLLGMAGALAVIGDAMPFLLVANLSAWPIARGLTGAARRRFLLRWIGGQAAVLLAVAPLYVAMSRSIDDHFMAAFNWIPPLSAMRAWRVGADVYLLRTANIDSLHLLPIGLPALGLAVPLLAGAGFVALRRQPAARIVMVLAIIVLPALLVLSEPARPLWLPRYLLWSGAAFLILAGVGAAWLARHRVAASAVAAALLLINVLPFYHAETVPRWDLAAAALAPALAAGADVFADEHGIPTMLRAYLPGGDAALPDNRVLFRISEAEARLRAGAPIIAIHGPIGQGLTSRMSAFRARVGRLGTPAGETRIGQEIVFLRFNPTPGRASGPSAANAANNVRPIP